MSGSRDRLVQWTMPYSLSQIWTSHFNINGWGKVIKNMIFFNHGHVLAFKRLTIEPWLIIVWPITTWHLKVIATYSRFLIVKVIYCYWGFFLNDWLLKFICTRRWIWRTNQVWGSKVVVTHDATLPRSELEWTLGRNSHIVNKKKCSINPQLSIF